MRRIGLSGARQHQAFYLCFPLSRLGRIIRHVAGDGVPGRVRFLSRAVTLAEGAKQTWVTLTRAGNFTDPRYGNFAITPALLGQMVANSDKRVLGQDVFIDVSHKPSDGAAARVLRLSVEDGRLQALVLDQLLDIGASPERRPTNEKPRYR